MSARGRAPQRGRMKLYVVRHCSTECSEKKIYCGSSDIPLSPRGEEEAKSLTERAKKYRFDLVISSPLLRARQTARAVVGERALPVLYDDRLRERNFGAFEGTSVEAPEGKVYRYSFPLQYPGGESYLQVAARVYAFLDEVREKYAGKDIFIVSHGSACRVIRSYFRQMADEEFYAYSQPNGTIEEYEM